MAIGFLLESIILVVISLFLLYKYLTWNYTYWKTRNVPYIPPIFPFGSIKSFVTNQEHMGISLKALCNKMSGERYFGILELGNPCLVLIDPKLIKAVLVSDFKHFADRGHVHEDVTKDFLNRKALFNLKGDAWKKLRMKMTPIFTTGRIKLMFELMEKCSKRLDKYLDRAAENNELIEVKDLIARFTSDSTSSSLFGLETNSIFEKDSEVRKIGNLILSPNKWNMIKLMICINYPFIYDLFNIETVEGEVKRFCMQLAKETYNFRVENSFYRNDFIDLLIKIKQNKNLLEDEKSTNVGSRKTEGNDDGLTFEEMAAQICLMFFAGFETSSSASTFALYEMWKHPDILSRVVKEVDDVLRKHDNQITYQALIEMNFLEQVIYETLRLYPAVSVLTRKCTQNYKVADSDLVIEKGIRVIIPTLAVNLDPKTYPNPYEFDPDRFSPERIQERGAVVNLQFGDGPMMCLGVRFGKIQVKFALVTVLSKYRLVAVPETPRNLTWSPLHFFPSPVEPIKFKVAKRTDIDATT